MSKNFFGEAHRVSKKITDLVRSNKVMVLLNEGLSVNCNRWTVNKEGKVRKISSTLSMIHAAVALRGLRVQGMLSHEDGYLVPLVDGGWLRLLLTKNTPSGMTLYLDGLAYKVTLNDGCSYSVNVGFSSNVNGEDEIKLKMKMGQQTTIRYE
ncbi:MULTISPECIES: hypothetical protein [Bacillus amyloliquefaciens group]|uniref:hypothetical protein n=1 Tax=Bacillus amyloliquefaciens group TaxID=1938374 RepID=UPI00073CF605|nr:MULTISPECIES: hypothetical protein [Bacillus amyloliquefaciens group]KTF59087.1 hypothetical protein AR691_17545 [Bacillus amyloliquefaciens]